jgi:hypothetical protein
MSKTRKIYVYTTETYKTKNWYKIGETFQDVQERVVQQDGTSNPESLAILDSWDSADFSDKDFHRFLEKSGYSTTRQDRSREWYVVPGGAKQIRALYNEMSSGVARPNSYKMRPEQQAGCDKAVSFFRNGGQDFLFAAVMRYGKCFVSLELCRELKYKNVLLLTWKPQVSDSWREDIRDHVNYDDWEAVQARDPSASEKISTTGTTVVYESFQELINTKGKKKVEWIFSQEWDLIILDEEHYGTKTDNSQAILSRFPESQRYLYLSGTPFSSLASGKFDDDSTYRWTYTEEALVRLAQQENGWVPDTHRCLPKLHFFGIDISSKIIEKFEGKGFTGDHGFNIKKVFATNSGGDFLYPTAVSGLLDALAEQAGPDEVCLSPYNMDSLGSDKLSLLNHTFWYLPKDVQAIAALEHMLSNHDFFGDYKIINASGGNVKDIERAKLLIQQKKRTITLSCGRFNTGVSVPKWGAVFMFDGGESAEDYFQTIFRAKTPWAIRKDEITGAATKWKEDALVFDFDPHRQLAVTYDYCVGTKSVSETTEEAVKNFFKVANIIQHGELKTVEVDSSRLLEAAASRGRGLGAFGSARAVNPLTITEDLAQVFGNLSKAAARKLVDQIGDTELQKGKISSSSSQNKKAANKEKRENQKKLKDLQQKLQQAVARIPTYLLIDYDKQINSCADLVLEGDQSLFKSVTGYTLKNFEDALQVGCIRKEWIDSSIVDMNLRINKLSLEEFLGGSNNIFSVLGAFERDGKSETPGTPGKLVFEMLDRLPQSIWNNPNKKFIDPACSTGTFLLEVFRRLYNGLEEIIVDPDERIHHILTNQLYGVEENIVPYRMTRAAFGILLGNQFDINKMHLGSYNILKEELDMKFDVVVMNPPYQAAPKSDKNKGQATGNTIWNKFVENALVSWLKEDGLLCAVHPSGWRKPESPRSKYSGLFNLMAQKYHMKYLEIHDAKDGMDTFNAATRYDWYVVDKSSPGGLTKVVGQDGKSSDLDLKTRPWLENCEFGEVSDILGSGCNVIYSRSAYASDKSWTSPEETGEFRHPLIHSTTKSGVRYYYSSLNDKGHFGLPKVIFGDSGINDVVIDLEGKYGITEHAMALPVRDSADAIQAKEFLMSEKFQNILSSCRWSNFQIDWRLFTHFKEGFWRD